MVPGCVQGWLNLPKLAPSASQDTCTNARMLLLERYFAIAGLASLCSCAAVSTPPIIDLGYGLWQGNLNATGRYYNFSNVRYAQAPIGELRWAPPQAPLTNRSQVNDGQDGRICPQAVPSWAKERVLFYEQYLRNPNNISAFTDVPPPGINTSAIAPPARDGRTNEDCLFLQVLVPQCVFDNPSQQSKLPVFVWTYGGGFYAGDLQSQGNPAGLLARSMAKSADGLGMIYVSVNYRLGALGWLSGPTFNASGGYSNAGLYDQRFALEWVQEHISKFGGDPNRVTLAGESAGASMSLQQVTAFGNSTSVPFQQLYTASPAFHPSVNVSYHEEIYHQFLANANVSTFAELRSAPSEIVIRANELSVFQAPYGDSGFGPIIGDIFVPDSPDVLLTQGRHATNIQAYMAAHNTDEGLIFANPTVQNTSAFNSFLQSSLLPGMPLSEYDYLVNTLYPADFNNETGLGYNDTVSRLSTLLADWFVNCNANMLLKTLQPTTARAFLFAEGAGLHGEDTPYIFYNPPGPMEDAWGIGTVNETSAIAIQDWIVNFVLTGDPNGANHDNTTIYMPLYGPQRFMTLVNSSQLGKVVPDPAQEQRCQFWQNGSYLGIPNH